MVKYLYIHLFFLPPSEYEEACDSPPVMGASLPKLLCVITGKGPMKEHYLSIINETKFKYIEFCTPWLEAEDYPTLLGTVKLRHSC